MKEEVGRERPTHEETPYGVTANPADTQEQACETKPIGRRLGWPSVRNKPNFEMAQMKANRRSESELRENHADSACAKTKPIVPVPSLRAGPDRAKQSQFRGVGYPGKQTQFRGATCRAKQSQFLAAENPIIPGFQLPPCRAEQSQSAPDGPGRPSPRPQALTMPPGSEQMRKAKPIGSGGR